MGNRRMGLARMEALMKALLKKSSIDDRDFGYLNLGLSQPWVNNFGAGAEAVDAVNDETGENSTSNATLFSLALALEHVAERQELVSAAEATSIFGTAASAGVDKAMSDTTADKVGTNLQVVRLTGNVTSNVVYADAADLASAGHSALMLFNDNILETGHTITIGMNDNNELDKESFEICCTGNGNQILTRQADTTDLHQDIILTATGDTTILAGSYLYFYASNATDVMCVKGCIRTTGGTVAVTTAN
tara:strand:- start:359 stop:1102 length:744 start_codon:yes stop_codon:yes gene_type:complete